MAAAARGMSVNLNNRRMILTTCLCVLIAFLVFQIGIAFTFVIISVVSVALLWYFWAETWFRPSETRATIDTGKRERDFTQTETYGLPQQEHGPYQQNTHEQSFNFTKSDNLVRRPLRVKRTNAYSNKFVQLDGSRNKLNTKVNSFEFDKTREGHRQIFSPIRGSGNLTFAALTGNPTKGFTSPRETMSFSSSFLYSPNKAGSPNNSICNTSHRHYPTHQPEYSGLGQLPVVRWNNTDSPVWKRRTSMQSPVMIKIAPPDTVRSESPLVQSVVEEKEVENPCNKASVIAAIRECRKRGVDDNDDCSSTASLPWEQGSKRRRVDGFSRSNTPSVASSSEYDTAPPSRAESTVSSLNSNVPGPKGLLSRTPRNAIISSFSSAKKLKKRKHPEPDDVDETDLSPSKKPTLGLDITSKEMDTEDDQSEQIPNNGNKENQPETPKRTPAKRGQERDNTEDEGEKSIREENRTPRKRSLKQLLARQKTPLRGVGLGRKATQLMSNSPGQYTAADLAEDRHMAKQRVSYIREALKEPEPTESTTGATTVTSTSTSSLSSSAAPSLVSNSVNPGSVSSTLAAPKIGTTSSGLLSALSKATSIAGQSTITSGASATKPSGTPTLNLNTGTGPSTTSLSGSKAPNTSLAATLGQTSTGQASSAQTNAQTSNFFSGLSSTVKPALSAAPPVQTSATSVQFSLSGSKPPPPYSGTQTSVATVPAATLATTSLNSTMTTTASVLPGVFQQQTTVPTSSVNLLTQQIKSNDATNMAAPSGFQLKPQNTATSASAFQTTPPFNFGTQSTPATSLMSNSSITTSATSGTFSTSAPSTFAPPASTSVGSNSIFNTSTLSTPATKQSAAQSGSKQTFTPLFPSAANTTSAQTSAPTFNFSGSTATASLSTGTAGPNFKPIFSAPNQSVGTGAASNIFSANNPTSKPGGFQFNASTTASSNQPQTAGVFQFGGSANTQTTTAATPVSQPTSNLFTFSGQNNQGNPSSFGGATMAGQTQQSSTFGGATMAGQTQQTSTFGGATMAGQTQQSSTFGGATMAGQTQQTSTFGGATMAGQTQQTSTFGGATMAGQTQQNSIFGQSSPPSQPQNQTQVTFGGSAKPFSAPSSQTTASPFGGSVGSASTNQNPFGGTTQQQQQNMFGGSQPQQADNPFGATNQSQTQNPFGGVSQSQNAFGASSQPTASTGVFTFGASNTKPNTGAVNNSSGFNFGAAAQQTTPASSGFNFSSAAPASSGFNFGQSQQQQQHLQQQQQQQQQHLQQQQSQAFQFGQQTPTQAPTQPFGTPSNTQPFNFAGAGSSTGFASAPTSGRSTPVGNFSVGASSGTSTAAQRRARMRQARGRSGRR